MMSSYPLRRRTFLSCLTAGLVVARSANSLEVEPAALRIGLTPVFLDNEWQLLEALRAHFIDVTGREVEFVQRRTYKEIVALLLLGDLDAAWLCGYPMLQNADRLQALAIPIWQGQPRYQSYIITGHDRDADALADLRGDIHAYSDPDSNSGHLVTVAELLSTGYRPEAFFERTFFTFGHRNVVRAVARRLAQSGSVDGYVFDAISVVEPELVAGTKVLWRSDWHAFPPIVIPSEARGSSAAEALSRAFFQMGDTPTGREVLRLLQLDGFARPQPDSFDSIAELIDRVATRK